MYLEWEHAISFVFSLSVCVSTLDHQQNKMFCMRLFSQGKGEHKLVKLINDMCSWNEHSTKSGGTIRASTKTNEPTQYKWGNGMSVKRALMRILKKKRIKMVCSRARTGAKSPSPNTASEIIFCCCCCCNKCQRIRRGCHQIFAPFKCQAIIFHYC